MSVALGLSLSEEHRRVWPSGWLSANAARNSISETALCIPGAASSPERAKTGPVSEKFMPSSPKKYPSDVSFLSASLLPDGVDGRCQSSCIAELAVAHEE